MGALRYGLILCQNLQLIALEIELDAKAIVNLLAKSILIKHYIC